MGVDDAQRQRLLKGSDILERGTQRLAESTRLALDTEDVGANILQDLRRQREQIEHSRDTVCATVADVPAPWGRRAYRPLYAHPSTNDSPVRFLSATDMQGSTAEAGDNRYHRRAGPAYLAHPLLQAVLADCPHVAPIVLVPRFRHVRWYGGRRHSTAVSSDVDHMSRAPTFRAPEGIYTCFDWSNPLQNKSASQYGADPGIAAANPSEAMAHSRVALRGEVPRLSGTVVRPSGTVDSAPGFLTIPEPIANQGIQADTLRLPALGPAAGASGPAPRQARPKQSLKNATNSLISRVQTYQDFSRAFSSLNKPEPLSITIFSAGKSVFWLTQLQNKIRDPVIRLQCTQSPLCHDVNQYTRQPDRLDVAIGFDSGDILWVDPIAQRYSRINKDGCLTKASVRQIAWLPGSETVFFTTHDNGCVYIWDVERDDSSEAIEVAAPPSSWDARRSILADLVPDRIDMPSPIPWRSGRSKDSTGTNPVRYWRVSRRALTDLKFSPNSKQVAIGCDDGILRIIDLDSEKYVQPTNPAFRTHSPPTLAGSHASAGPRTANILWYVDFTDCRRVDRMTSLVYLRHSSAASWRVAWGTTLSFPPWYLTRGTFVVTNPCVLSPSERMASCAYGTFPPLRSHAHVPLDPRRGHDPVACHQRVC